MSTASHAARPAPDPWTLSPIVLRRRIRRALRAGATLQEIERDVLARAPLEEEHRDALWLYAWALAWRLE